MTTDKEISHYEILEQKVVFGEAEKLEDSQLLSLIIRSGKDNSLQQAEKLINSCERVNDLVNLSVNDIIRIGGLNKKQAVSICATFELIKRLTDNDTTEKTAIKSNLDVISIFKPTFSRLDIEELWVLYLTATNKIIKKVKISSGGAISTYADIKLILKNGIELLAHSMIISHNHPSGDASPSDDDIEFTKQLYKASELMEIKLLDHIVISKNDSFSFLENRIL